MGTNAAEHRGGSAVDQDVADELTAEWAAAAAGIAQAGSGLAVDQYVSGAADEALAAVAGLRALCGVAESGGGFAGHANSLWLQVCLR
ncbi:hypothetical protein MFKK_14170 [Halopseudomonas aestusnigri]|nr:hypothetical protein MFKK_14170 [Halopseudomonas aestusnigri]